MQSFEAAVVLPAPAATLFDFLVRPDNVRKISPPGMGLCFLQAPERNALGSRMEFRVQAFGVSREATHEITAFDEPVAFTERQVSGPFGHWVHEHRFEALDGDRVRVVDRIEFESPGGMLRFILTPKIILENLEEAFDHRHGELERVFGR